jgi:O-Antigen ligase
VPDEGWPDRAERTLTNSAPAASQRNILAGRRGPPRWILFVLFAGGGIGALISLLLYSTTPLYAVLLPLGGALLLPTLFLKNFRLYWLALFLLSLQFTASKNLNDGRAVMEALKIDYIVWHFTFEITATDLALLMLCIIWVNDGLFHKKPPIFPPVGWLAVGYLGLALLSIVGTASPYLGLVEMSRQLKFFIVFLFAVNCLDSKSVVRVLAIACVITLVAQAGVTVLRVKTGYYTPIVFGDFPVDLDEIKHYLMVDRYDSDSIVRGYGTLGSPGGTVRLCMLMIPFALFLCFPNAMFKRRLAFVGLTVFSLVGLVFTFDRVYFIITAVQLALVFFIMLRDRMVKRDEAIAILLIGLIGVVAVSPKLYDQFTVRQDSWTVRFLQYEAATNMILAHPFLGVGLNNTLDQKRNYLNLTYYPGDPDMHFYEEPTHNVYLSMASEIGVLATLLFIAFFANATIVAWRQSRGSPDPETRLAANALVVAFCSAALNGMMDPLDETPVLALLWLYAGISLNLYRMARTPRIAASSA